MKQIKTIEAEGHVLCHDITQIIPGQFKGVVFKKGHIVTKEDIPVLLSVGKENLYVWEKQEGILHEDEAAEILREICMGQQDSMTFSSPSEGKIEIKANSDGLLKIRSDALLKVNSLGGMMIATIKGNFPVRRGDKIAGTRIIPLVIEKERMDKAKEAAGDEPILKILPFKHVKVGIIITGSEVYSGRIKDAFGPVLKAKLSEYDTSVINEHIVSDDKEMIINAANALIDEGAEMLLISGGMSVDPDDRTPGAIRDLGAEIVSYGAPVLPGAMFLLSYLKRGNKDIPVLGLPGCIMYAKRTIFDLMLPRVLAGETLKESDIAVYGEGGLCLNCSVCIFPSCGFGK